MVFLLRFVSELRRISCGSQVKCHIPEQSYMESGAGLCPPTPKKKDGLIWEQEAARGRPRQAERGSKGPTPTTQRAWFCGPR